MKSQQTRQTAPILSISGAYQYGLTHDICKRFNAGVVVNGENQGLIGFPMHGATGVVIGYGYYNPRLECYWYPAGIDLQSNIFNCHRIKAGSTVRLVRDPIHAMCLSEFHEEHFVAFYSEMISEEQISRLKNVASLGKALRLIIF